MSVSIPEKREIPFEGMKLQAILKLKMDVSIPEKREIPFEANVAYLYSVAKNSFNP